jgi:hypothetical protein
MHAPSSSLTVHRCCTGSPHSILIFVHSVNGTRQPDQARLTHHACATVPSSLARRCNSVWSRSRTFVHYNSCPYRHQNLGIHTDALRQMVYLDMSPAPSRLWGPCGYFSLKYLREVLWSLSRINTCEFWVVGIVRGIYNRQDRTFLR